MNDTTVIKMDVIILRGIEIHVTIEDETTITGSG